MTVMKLNIFRLLGTLLLAASVTLLPACTDDLDQKPHVGTTSDDVYSTVDGYRSMLAKIYASYVLIGQEKAGNADLSSYAGQDLMRSYFNLQEGTTDEAAFRWLSGDNLWDLALMSWDANDPQVSDTYYRLYYNIALANEFLRYCTDGKIGGFSADDQADIRTYAAEARFMRALSYYIVLDLFRQGPYVDENTPTSGYTPEAMDATAMISLIESEINDILPTLLDNPPYARAGKGAAYMLLARMYLNCEVYNGTNRYTDCIDACRKVMALGYTLEPEYTKIFNADNNLRTNEIIFAFAIDATEASTWGASTYLICGSVGSDNSQTAADYGISTGWGNFRCHGQFYNLFTSDADGRKLFWTDGQEQYITNSLEDATQGYHPCKWTNLTDAGEAASNSASDGCSTDVPFFRLADVYLMAAEATLRGGSGMTASEALDLVNALRERAYGNTSGNINTDDLTLDFILDERGRELYLEYVRRTDLVRFDRYTTSKYLWNWKGGVSAGRAVDSRYNIFPIPAAEISANPNLSNPNY